MFNKLSDDLIQYIIGFLELYLKHDIKYIKEKIISLEIYFLKQVNHLLNKNVELFFKNKIKTVFVIEKTITKCYNDTIFTLYLNEIAKIGNINMFYVLNKFDLMKINKNINMFYVLNSLNLITLNENIIKINECALRNF